MTVGIVVVVVVMVVVAALGWWWWCCSGSQNISINMYIIRKIYCVKLPTVCYQANTETSTQHARPFVYTFTDQHMAS